MVVIYFLFNCFLIVCNAFLCKSVCYVFLPESKNDVTTKPAGTSDDIYCCEGCGCYGLASEFVSSRFCSHTCATSFASKKAAQSKKERDLLQLRLRRRKKRLLQLMQQQLQNQQQVSQQQQVSVMAQH
jgi:hypothetical protein